MRKITLSLFVSLVIGFPTQASANPGQKSACEKSGGEWHPLAGTPQCDCSKRTDLFSLLAPGKDAKLQRINALAYVKADVCESRELGKTSSNINKTEKPKTETPKTTPVSTALPPPDCKLAQNSIDARANAPASNKVICTGNVAKISKVVTSCDNCTTPADRIVSKKDVKDAVDLTTDIAVTADPGIKESKVGVSVLGKNMQIQLTYSVNWELSACAKTRGTDANNTCICPVDMMVALNTDGVPVCIAKPKTVEAPKPVPAKVVEVKQVPVKGEKGDSGPSAPSIHLLIEPKCLYASSEGWKTGECFFSAGLTGDITDYLKAYGLAGIGTPGATNVDTEGNPILLSNGKPDERKLSVLIELGLRLKVFKALGARAGVFRRMDGETNGFTSPIHVTTGGLVGIDVSGKVGGHTVGAGLFGGCGSHKWGSMNSDRECMVGLNLFFEGWTGK